MDPLSLLAGIAGVATAGIQISKAIYDLVSSISGTPKEISDIAREVSDLSIVLSELRRALKEGRNLYRRKLLRRVSSAIRRIGQIHAQIREMIAGVEGFASLRWLFRRSKATQLLYQIESHKNGINMILHIMTLAVQTRMMLGRMTNPSDSHSNSDDRDGTTETDLLRQHAENLVQVSYQSLRDAMGGQDKHAESFETDQADEPVPEPDGSPSTQLQLWKENSERENTTQWLYELVFSSYAESLSGLPTASKIPDSDAEEEQPAHKDGASNKGLTEPISSPPKHMQLAVMIQRPVEVSSVVDELLAEWTTLTEDEIAGVVEKGPRDNLALKPPVKFKDAVGRKFSFPYHLVQTWAGATKLINEAFLHVDVIGPHVQKGHYDVVGPDGDIILPSLWEHVIQPGDLVTMHMWPMDKSPLRERPPNHGLKPVPPIKKPSPTKEEVETKLGVRNGAVHAKRQVEVDKAPTSSQGHRNHPREDKQDRDSRRKPMSSTRSVSQS